MKFLLGILLIIGLGAGYSFLGFGPWWIVAVIACLVAFQMRLPAFSSFAMGLLGVIFLWAGHAYFINSANDGALLAKISEVLTFGPSALWAVMLTLGGLVGGFGAMTGTLFRAAFIGDIDSNKRRRRR